jgi:hypothetical protein
MTRPRVGRQRNSFCHSIQIHHAAYVPSYVICIGDSFTVGKPATA